VPDVEKQLRCLAMNDEATVASFLGLDLDHKGLKLRSKTRALVRLAALLGADAAPATYQWAVEVALAAGAKEEEVIGTMVAVAPVVGMARIVAAAPEIAIALGYPVEATLELIGEPRR
jgi:4-carboxymuconolactone decarboxylase